MTRALHGNGKLYQVNKEGESACAYRISHRPRTSPVQVLGIGERAGWPSASEEGLSRMALLRISLMCSVAAATVQYGSGCGCGWLAVSAARIDRRVRIRRCH